MLSQVAICNRALAKLGDSFIIDLTDTSKPARACNEAFAPVRDALLRSHRWSFAMTRAQLAALSTTPAFEYSLQYQMPADLLRLDYVGDTFVGLDMSDYRNASASDYKIEGRHILTNWAAPLNIRYIRQVTDTAQFDPLFDEALACKLAVELANSLAQSSELKDVAGKEFRATLMSAVRTNAIEKAPEPLPDDSWMLSRL